MVVLKIEIVFVESRNSCGSSGQLLIDVIVVVIVIAIVVDVLSMIVVVKINYMVRIKMKYESNQ